MQMNKLLIYQRGIAQHCSDVSEGSLSGIVVRVRLCFERSCSGQVDEAVVLASLVLIILSDFRYRTLKTNMPLPKESKRNRYFQGNKGTDWYVRTGTRFC